MQAWLRLTSTKLQCSACCSVQQGFSNLVLPLLAVNSVTECSPTKVPDLIQETWSCWHIVHRVKTMAKAIGKPALHAPLMTAYLLSSFEGLPKLAVSLATGEYLKLGQT